MQNIAFIAIRRADLSFVQNLLMGTRIPILLYIGYLGVLGVFYAIGIAYVITFIFGACMLYKYRLSFTKKINFVGLRKIMKFSLGNYTAGIFMIVPTTVIPLMIMNMLGAKESAYFFIAYSVASLLTMIPNAVSLSLFVEGAHSQPLKENIIKSLKLIITLLFPALIFIFIFGDKLLLLFGMDYSEQSLRILQLLAASNIFSAIIFIYISIKKIQKDVRMINYLSFSLSILIIGLGYVSLLKYGLVGLGYTWLVANAAGCLFVIRMTMRTEMHVRET